MAAAANPSSSSATSCADAASSEIVLALLDNREAVAQQLNEAHEALAASEVAKEQLVERNLKLKAKVDEQDDAMEQMATQIVTLNENLAVATQDKQRAQAELAAFVAEAQSEKDKAVKKKLDWDRRRDVLHAGLAAERRLAGVVRKRTLANMMAYESELRTAFKEQRLLQVEADHLEEKIRAATPADEEVANSQASHARA